MATSGTKPLSAAQAAEKELQADRAAQGSLDAERQQQQLQEKLENLNHRNKAAATAQIACGIWVF